MTDNTKINFDEPASDTLWVQDTFDAIQLPKDASLELVIELLNAFQFNFTDEKRAKRWKPYVKTISLKDDKE